MLIDFQWMAQRYISEDRTLRSRNSLPFMSGTGRIITMFTGICKNDVLVIQTHVCRGADKSLAFPISPTFILIILLSHQSLLFLIC
jgi:hypothetical protein